MKVGVRKPSIKRSLKARTTGKAKRKIKKTINPLYGKKGMGYVRNPKKAVYNKVYHKTTIGVPTAVRAASGLAGKKSKKKPATTRVSANNNVRPNNVPANRGNVYYYNTLIKDKPSIIPTIVCGIVTLLCILSIVAFVFMLLVTGAVFAYYKYMMNKKDYYTDEQLEEWARVLHKYDGIPRNPNYKSLKNGSIMELNKTYNKLQPYVNMREPFDKPEDYLYAITISEEIIDFSPFICIKNPNERLQPQFWKDNYDYYLNQYYQQEYNSFVQHAKTLKTENGKKNQINRFKDKVEVTVSAIDPNYEEKMNNIIKESDFC